MTYVSVCNDLAQNPPLAPRTVYDKGMKNETLSLTTVAQVQDALDELGLCNGYWAGELSLLGCATLFDLDLDPEDVEDVTAILFDDEYGPTELGLVAEALAEREADPEALGWGDLVVVAERFGADPQVLSACLAGMLEE